MFEEERDSFTVCIVAEEFYSWLSAGGYTLLVKRPTTHRFIHWQLTDPIRVYTTYSTAT